MVSGPVEKVGTRNTPVKPQTYSPVKGGTRSHENKRCEIGYRHWANRGLGLGYMALVHAESAKEPTSYSPVVITEPFDSIMARWKAAKPGIMKRQMDLLDTRYDLRDQPAKGVTMSRGKPIQEGVPVKLPEGMTWEKLAAMSPEEIREKEHLSSRFLPSSSP